MKALSLSWLAALTMASAALATPMAASAALAAKARMLVSAVEPAPAADTLVVEITVLNTGATTGRQDFPARMAATLEVEGRRIPVELIRTKETPETLAIAPGGFAQARYTLPLPESASQGGTALLRLREQDTPGLAFALPTIEAGTALAMQQGAEAQATAQAPAAPNVAPPLAPVPSAKPETGNAYIGNLSAYAPIYAAYGPGTNTEIRLQFSFKYQLFGNPGAVGPGHSLLNGIHFGYTQRMFWDWSANSSPFRNIDFMPELFYLIPAQQVADGLSLGGQFGIRHASNGRDGADSRSINTLYVQPVATLPVGDDYSLSIGPLVEVYVGSLKDNPDIKRYRGNTGLLVEVGDDDGLRLSTNTRFSFQSGRASINAELSYPFDRIIDTSLNLYLFGQAFTGYGENLLDYNRRDTRFRIGFAIVR